MVEQARKEKPSLPSVNKIDSCHAISLFGRKNMSAPNISVGFVTLLFYSYMSLYALYTICTIF